MVESASDEILAGAAVDDVAFLVVGDPFGYGEKAAGGNTNLCLHTF